MEEVNMVKIFNLFYSLNKSIYKYKYKIYVIFTPSEYFYDFNLCLLQKEIIRMN